MTRWPFALAAAVLGTLTGAAHLQAQLPPDKALAAMKPADGLKVELFAHEPMLLNPTAMDVDHRGRVWVTEAVNYRRKNFNRPILRPEGDRVVILTDTNGDGKADDSTVFYQGTDLYGPLGIAVAATPASGTRQGAEFSYKVFVCQSPDILLFHDKDGDGKADGPPEKFLTGFGGFDHDHGVHSILIGPDGKLYFTVGDAGVTGLQGRDGKGPKWKSNTTDVQKGTVWRCDFDGGNLELIAHNFRNNYECCVDSFGEIWLSDNDDDGNQQTRICHVMPGGNYGYGPRGPGQTHWHEEQPGIVHKTLRTGFGSPTGICFYEGNLLPEKYRGHLLHADAGPREVRCFHRKPKGAGYELDKTVLLTSSDNWFRPSDVCVAPDGSVFVADWYDRGVGGHGMGDPTDGRIYRLTPKGHAGYKVPTIDVASDSGLRTALSSPNLATRHIARQTLLAMPEDRRHGWVWESELGPEPPKHVGGLTGWLHVTTKDWERTEVETHTNLMKLGEGVHAAAIKKVVAHPRYGDAPFQFTPRLMKARYGKLANAPQPFRDSYRRIARHCPTPAVGRELLLALKDDDAAFVKDWFYDLAKLYDGQDHFYRAALNIACGTDPARRDAILADFDKHFPVWDDKTADLVWELRPKSVLPRLAKLMADPKLSAPQKARIVDILAVNDDPAAGTTMLSLVSGEQPAEVKARAIENLRLFLPTKWAAVAQSDGLKAAVGKLLADPTARVTGLQLVAAANYRPAVDQVARIAADPSGPAAVRAEAVRTLGDVPAPKAVEALKGLLADPAVARDAVAALADHLGARRNPNPAAQQALAALQGVVTDAGAADDLKRAAVSALAGTRAGTGWLLQLKEKNQLPAALAADAGRLLRNSPFQGERNKALLLFPAPGKLDIAKLPSIPELARRKGSAENGKAILARSMTSEVQCLKCHTVRGVGGQIGPDLSMVGKKGSRENLFESILQPSKAIADQSVSWKIDTADGQSLTGLLVQETPKAVVIRDANGKDYEVPVADIEKRTKSLVSLMPDNLAAALTEDELVDVVEYMATLQTAALTPAMWHVVGPFDSPNGNAGLNQAYPVPIDGFDPAGKYAGKAGPVGWTAVRAGAGGYVDLAALHGRAAANSVSFAVKTIDSPVEQEATVVLGTDDGAKLYLNGEVVFESAATRAAAPDQDTVKVKLKPGANTLLLKIANGDGPHGFYLTVLSGQELKTK